MKFALVMRFAEKSRAVAFRIGNLCERQKTTSLIPSPGRRNIKRSGEIHVPHIFTFTRRKYTNTSQYIYIARARAARA